MKKMRPHASKILILLHKLVKAVVGIAFHDVKQDRLARALIDD